MPLTSPRGPGPRVAAASSRAFRRIAADIWPLLQGTAAATTAWVIARYAFGWPEPFFAPIAALVALNTSQGERGLNALRLLQGVIVGIVMGEIVLTALGTDFGSMALAVFSATAFARGLGGNRVVIAQAAVGAILTVALGHNEAGWERLRDALVGAGVALVFSQLLFSPEPLALLRRAEMQLLARMVEGLALTALALRDDDDALAAQAIGVLRALPDELGELRRVRRVSANVARRTLVGRSRRRMVVQENENANHLDLLCVSSLQLARVVPSMTATGRQVLEQPVRELMDILGALADDLGDREARQRTADRAFAVATTIGPGDADADASLAAGVIAVRAFALDLIVFAGVTFDEAEAAVREGVLDKQVPPPAVQPRGPFGWIRSRLPWTR